MDNFAPSSFIVINAVVIECCFKCEISGRVSGLFTHWNESLISYTENNTVITAGVSLIKSILPTGQADKVGRQTPVINSRKAVVNTQP